MYIEISKPRARKITALFVSSGIAILAASAMSTSAQAIVVKQESQREIQTLGGKAGDGGVIASIFASRMRNPILTPEGAKFDGGDGVDDDFDFDDGQPVGEQVNQSVGEGPDDIGIQATAVPEPGILGLFGAGLLGLGILRRRRG